MGLTFIFGLKHKFQPDHQRIMKVGVKAGRVNYSER
jgi:hypothetical protein